MRIEICIECDCPTGKEGACEDSLYVGDNGPFCETCFEWKEMVAEHKAVVEKLEAEVARLKEEMKLLPELTQKAERYREVCDVLKRPQGEDVVGMVESISKEWAEFRAEKIVGTTISIEQAQEASRQAGKDAAVHTVRACAQWLRINGWHNSVRDTAIEMERLMVEDVNRTYGTPGMCVPPKEEHFHHANVTKPEFDKLCARVEALEQALHGCSKSLEEEEDQQPPPSAERERRRIVAYIRNIGGDDYRTVISPQRLAEEIENGNHWKKI